MLDWHCAIQFIYGVQEVINCKRSKASDRINILPQDLTPPGYTALLPQLRPPPPQRSTHIVTTWGADPHNTRFVYICVCEGVVVCLCVVWVHTWPLRAEATQRLILKLENYYVVMLCRRTEQLRGSAYANFPHAPQWSTAVSLKDCFWKLIMWPNQLQVYQQRKCRKLCLMSAEEKKYIWSSACVLCWDWVENTPFNETSKSKYISY